MDIDQAKLEKIFHQVQKQFAEWKQLTFADIKFTRQLGLTNITFKLEVLYQLNSLFHLQISTNIPFQITPKQIFYRQFCKNNSFIQRSKETFVFELISSAQLGPKALYSHKNYRIEEWLSGRHPNISMMRNQEFRRKILHQIVQIQQLEIPESFQNQQAACLEAFEESSPISQKFYKIFSTLPKKVQPYKSLMKQIDEEINIFIKQIKLPKEQKLVFAHNDLLQFNIFILNKNQDYFKITQEDQILFIDYEYAGNNLPAFDIANHLNEGSIDYSYNKYPYFELLRDEEFSNELFRDLAKYYLYFQSFSLQELQELNLKDICQNPELIDKYFESLIDSKVEEKIEAFIAEIKLCILISNLYWILWAIGSYDQLNIQFDYLEFARQRFEVYLELKRQFLSEINDSYF